MRLWRARWSILRLVLAGFLLWVVLADAGGRAARRGLAALPDFDYVQEVRVLRERGKFGEAFVIARAGVRAANSPAQREAITKELELTKDAEASWLRRIKDVGVGAMTGRGTSLEQLIGAIGSDMFVVGDIRDLVIEGGKYALDGEADEVVLALSAIGVATTFFPEVDWLPSVLKAAKRAGAMSKNFAEMLTLALKEKRLMTLRTFAKDAEAVAAKAGPSGVARVLRYANDTEEFGTLARFVERNEDGAFALMTTGERGAEIVKAGGEAAVLRASTKGRAGVMFLESRLGRAMLKPHPLLGIMKSVWKGNAAALVERMLEKMDGYAWWIVGILAGWVAWEVGRIFRVMKGERGKSAS